MYAANVHTPKEQVLETLILLNGEFLLPDEVQTEVTRYYKVKYPLDVINETLNTLYQEGELECQEELDGIAFGS